MAPFSLPVFFHNSNIRSQLVLKVYMSFKGKRSVRVGPWHNCARCDDKTHISELEWQRGLLLCPKCYDKGNDGFPLTGQREEAISSYLSNETQELMPDPKLTDNEAITASIDDGIII